VSISKKLFIGEDLNEHVSSTRVGLGCMEVSGMGVGTKKEKIS
jgi:hypothetical protein